MKVHVRFFALAAQLAGTDSAEVTLDARSTVADLRYALGEAIPELRALMPHLMIALDSEYATDTTTILADSEIACFPPVSGG